MTDIFNADSALASAENLFSRANKAGLFLPDAQDSPILRSLVSEAKSWIKGVEKNIDGFTSGEALEIVGSYFNVIHCMAFDRPAKPTYINRYILEAFDDYIHGERHVDEYTLFRAVSHSLDRRRDKMFFGRPLSWRNSTLDYWYKEFRNGYAADTISYYDTVQRVGILLKANLQTFEASQESEFKKTLFLNHRHYFNDIKAKGIKDCRALNFFLNASTRYMPDDKIAEIETSISSRISELQNPE